MPDRGMCEEPAQNLLTMIFSALFLPEMPKKSWISVAGPAIFSALLAGKLPEMYDHQILSNCRGCRASKKLARQALFYLCKLIPRAYVTWYVLAASKGGLMHKQPALSNLALPTLSPPISVSGHLYGDDCDKHRADANPLYTAYHTAE